MTLEPAQAWELVETARRPRTGSCSCPTAGTTSPSCSEAKALMDEGASEQAQYALCHMASPTKGFFAGGGRPPDRWEPTIAEPDPATWQSPEHGGGYAHGQITHSSALLLWLTGLRASRVSALMTRPDSLVDMYDAATVTFDGGAIGAISGAATLPDNDKFQVDLRIFGTEGVLLLDVERERVEVRRHDGAHVHVDVEPGEGAYSCDVPPVRFVELIQGRGRNNSPGEVAARSVELIDAMQRSAAADGVPVDVWRAADGTFRRAGCDRDRRRSGDRRSDSAEAGRRRCCRGHRGARPRGRGAVAARSWTTGGRAIAVEVDVSVPETMERAVEHAEATFGPPDVLVNNAGNRGLRRPGQPEPTMTGAAVSPSIWTVSGMARGRCCPRMLERGRGAVVNVASVHSFQIIPHCFPYPVAKHGVIGLTRALAVEYAGRGLRVNAVCPSYIGTQILEDYLAHVPRPGGRARAGHRGFTRWDGSPGRTRIAAAIAFLASDECGFMTGVSLMVDGGAPSSTTTCPDAKKGRPSRRR